MSRLPFKDRLLISDMDGTLLDSKGRVSRENKEALDRFVEGGGLFTVATGRMEKSILRFLPDIPMNVPAIVYNGAAIYDFKKDKILWQDNLTPSVLEPVKQIIKQFPGIGVEFYHGGKTYFAGENEYTLAHTKREQFKPIISEPEDIPQPWYKVILAWDPAKLKDVEEYLGKFDDSFRHTYSEPQFLELLNKHTSKGHALKVLTGMPGLSDSCVIAMGDNLNDVELIKEANIGIAVGNAHSILKIAADFCCTHHDSNAVSEVIEWLEDGKIVC